MDNKQDMENKQEMLLNQAKIAKTAARKLAILPTSTKNAALLAMANALKHRKETILEANAQDMAAAKEKKMAASFMDRLLLTEERIEDMADGLQALAALNDPVGKVDGMWFGAQNLQIGQVRVPLGVVGIIYEARPNVTADAAGICLKTGNAVILRGSGDALYSNKAITEILALAAENAGAPVGSIQLVADPSREIAQAMMRLNGYIDVLIPRGGAGLIKSVVANATVPVIETGVGNCHIYVDEGADIAQAVEIVHNAKVQRPSTCNAAETLLVHEKIAADFLPVVGERLTASGVELRVCPKASTYLPQGTPATEEDYATEFLALIMAVKVVENLDEAMEHIAAYGTHHSEAILTRDYARARRFQAEVDAAAVYVNASTRFTDGFQYGFGAEMGISTQKLHTRGPMGLLAMTTIKYIINGDGQIRK